MKKRMSILLIFLILLSLFTFTGCDDGVDYTCGYCGRNMEHYYSYIGGRYTCYSCTKALRP